MFTVEDDAVYNYLPRLFQMKLLQLFIRLTRKVVDFGRKFNKTARNRQDCYSDCETRILSLITQLHRQKLNPGQF